MGQIKWDGGGLGFSAQLLQLNYFVWKLFILGLHIEMVTKILYLLYLLFNICKAIGKIPMGHENKGQIVLFSC